MRTGWSWRRSDFKARKWIRWVHLVEQNRGPTRVTLLTKIILNHTVTVRYDNITKTYVVLRLLRVRYCTSNPAENNVTHFRTALKQEARCNCRRVVSQVRTSGDRYQMPAAESSVDQAYPAGEPAIIGNKISFSAGEFRIEDATTNCILLVKSCKDADGDMGKLQGNARTAQLFGEGSWSFL